LQSNSILLKALLHSIILLCLLQASCTQYKPDLQLAEQLMERAPDSALHILQRIPENKISGKADQALYALLMSQALDKNDIKSESDSLTSIATEYYNADEPERAGYAWFYHARTANNRGDVAEQANNLLKAEEFVVKTNNGKLKALIYSDKAMMYKSQSQLKSSILYFVKAYNIFHQLHDNRNALLCLLLSGDNSLGLKNYKYAIYYYNIAARIADTTNDVLLTSSIYKNLGSVYIELKNYQYALSEYKAAPITHISIYDSNKYYLIAKTYLKLNQLDSARLYLSKVKEVGEMAPDYYHLWQKLYEKEGNARQSIYYAELSSSATDSLYKKKLEVSFAGLEKKFKYQGLQISNQRLEIKNKQKDVYLLFALVVLIAFGLVVTLWRLKVRRKQFLAQAQLLTVEKSLVKAEKQKVEKERENNTLLERQLKMQSIILLNIEQHRKNAILRPSTPKLITKEAKQKQNDVFYQELIACMDLEYNNFTQRLLEAHPSLMQRDVLICCFLLAGFETGMIATILDVKIQSMNVQRSRLRKKLNLSSSVDFIDFLVRF